jgi:ferrous iron transport protein A
MTLAELKTGQKAVVSGFKEYSPLTQRIMQLGVLEDTVLEVLRRAPAGDPIEIRLLGYALSLRQSEASLIELRDIR